MKLSQPNPKKKLRATAARRVSQARPAEEEEEPTIRLSSAFVIVLLLHFVAIGGILSFESIKVHQRGPGETAKLEAESKRAAEAIAAANVTEPKVAPGEILTAATRTTSANPTSTTPAAAQPKKSTPAAPTAAPASTVRDSGATHVVASGENPVGIARKYGVKYEDLLKINKIDDPRRLQIGQKLIIPGKSK